MTDEEKKAMESLIEIREFANLSSYKDTKISQLNAIDTVLNLIEKQSKEIEELKEYKHDAELTKVACCSAQNCEALNNCIKLERELQNADKKWEDKIKTKIEEVKDGTYDAKIVLQSLLEKE